MTCNQMCDSDSPSSNSDNIQITARTCSRLSGLYFKQRRIAGMHPRLGYQQCTVEADGVLDSVPPPR
jgi:hypothetical protein